MLAVIDVLLILIQSYRWVLIIAMVLSWLIAFNVVNMRNQLVATVYDIVYRLTEPLLAPIRRYVPPLGALDMSFLVLFLLTILAEQIIVRYIQPNVF